MEYSIVTLSCKVCKSELVSVVEKKTGFCSPCIPDFIKQTLSLLAKEVKNSALFETQLESSIEEIRTYRDIITKRAALDKAESEGRLAAARGSVARDNPYEAGNQENFFWEHGLIEGSRESAMGRMQSVMLWTIDVLDLVSQISSSEVRDKISTINAKLAPFLEEWAGAQDEEEKQVPGRASGDGARVQETDEGAGAVGPEAL